MVSSEKLKEILFLKYGVKGSKDKTPFGLWRTSPVRVVFRDCVDENFPRKKKAEV